VSMCLRDGSDEEEEMDSRREVDAAAKAKDAKLRRASDIYVAVCTHLSCLTVQPGHFGLPHHHAHSFLFSGHAQTI